MNDVWQHELAYDEKAWDKKLREKIHEREEKEWLERMQTKPKLRTYITLKHKLTFEQYLTHDDTKAREVMTRVRGGTNELRIETGRYPNTNRDRRLETHERICLLCMSGEVEDERHFMFDCFVYEDLRGKMFDVVKRVLLKKTETMEDVMSSEVGRQRILGALIGDGEKESEGKADLRRAALEYCRQAMKRRNGVVLNELDQRT
jgi:hypothetical protein